MISLAALVEKHGEAIDHDLWTHTGHRLHELGDALDWASLYLFIQGLGVDSALYRAENPDRYAWDSGIALTWMVADLIDCVNAFRYEYACSVSKNKPRKPEPYPRPGDKKQNIIGRDPIPISQFDEWWETH